MVNKISNHAVLEDAEKMGVGGRGVVGRDSRSEKWGFIQIHEGHRGSCCVGIWEEVTQTEGTAWASALKLIQENKEARLAWPGEEGTVRVGIRSEAYRQRNRKLPEGLVTLPYSSPFLVHLSWRTNLQLPPGAHPLSLSYPPSF